MGFKVAVFQKKISPIFFETENKIFSLEVPKIVVIKGTLRKLDKKNGIVEIETPKGEIKIFEAQDIERVVKIENNERKILKIARKINKVVSAIKRRLKSDIDTVLYEKLRDINAMEEEVDNSLQQIKKELQKKLKETDFRKVDKSFLNKEIFLLYKYPYSDYIVRVVKGRLKQITSSKVVLDTGRYLKIIPINRVLGLPKNQDILLLISKYEKLKYEQYILEKKKDTMIEKTLEEIFDKLKLKVDKYNKVLREKKIFLKLKINVESIDNEKNIQIKNEPTP